MRFLGNHESMTREPKTNPSKGIGVDHVLVKPVDLLKGEALRLWNAEVCKSPIRRTLWYPDSRFLYQSRPGAALSNRIRMGHERAPK